MTTLEQAARQALEVLDNTPIEYDFRGNPMDVEFGIQVDNAINALREALEQQPKQEPVAWMYDWEADNEIVCDWVSKDYNEAHSPTMGCTNIRPLYTQPQPAPAYERDNQIAELEHENNLLRARNERLQRTIDGVVARLEQACGANAMPPVMIKNFIHEIS